jgi:Mg2+ and Co2+ transporter CorA
MSFGFSVGDFLTALELVATVIDALRDSGDASSQNRELLRELYSLETALIRVKRLDFDDELQAELIALRQAVGQCQNTIEEFWKKIWKYQPHLQCGGSTSRVKDGWMRIRWALCKKDDVVKFKADLLGHTQSIQLLLNIIHM